MCGRGQEKVKDHEEEEDAGGEEEDKGEEEEDKGEEGQMEESKQKTRRHPIILEHVFMKLSKRAQEKGKSRGRKKRERKKEREPLRYPFLMWSLMSILVLSIHN